MNDNYFKVGNYVYTPHDSELYIKIIPEGICVSAMVPAINKEIDADIAEVSIEVSERFFPGMNDCAELVGQSGAWGSSDEGYFFMAEYGDIIEARLDFLEYNDDKMKIKMTGKANPYWDEEMGLYENVPFEIVTTASIIISNQ